MHATNVTTAPYDNCVARSRKKWRSEKEQKANVIDESWSGAIKSNENRPIRTNDDDNGDQY